MNKCVLCFLHSFALFNLECYQIDSTKLFAAMEICNKVQIAGPPINLSATSS